MPEKKQSLGESLKALEGIVAWFEDQQQVDVEEGLAKVKEGAVLIKASREKLKEAENEFEVVRKELEGEE
ncbi:MAG: exodeoxyribonuclease VII small subunit [Candidatus Moranbacteria bacterium]|nr:exodeoxyribonuclease VII small subunit [Candidatus Moranbacteria bacterium]